MDISLESLQGFVIMNVVRQILGQNFKLLRNTNVWELLRFVKRMKHPLLSHWLVQWTLCSLPSSFQCKADRLFRESQLIWCDYDRASSL